MEDDLISGDWSFEAILNDLKSDIEEVLWGILASITEFGADLLEAVPVPDFLAPMAGFVGSVPADVMYFAAPFELSYGLGAISAALASRLVLSLIPYVGSAFR